MHSPRSLRPALALIICAVSTACTNVVAGEAGLPGSESGVEAASAEALLGDLSTFDPCSVVEPSAFDEFGSADVVDQRSFDQCGLSLMLDSGGGVTIAIGRLSPAEAREKTERVAELADGLWIGQWYDDSSTCQQSLVFPDDVMLDVAVNGSGDAAGLCDVAEAGVRMAAEAVSSGAVEHHDYPEDSLALLDPCDFVTDDTVSELPVFADVERRESDPAGHSCWWAKVTDGEATTLSVEFTVGGAPIATGSGDQERDIAGRPTVITQYSGEGGAASCAVTTGHIESDISRPGAVELAEVSTYFPGGADSACDSAVVVATEVWELLPRP